MKDHRSTLIQNNRQRILLITGIFPPQIGGPATFMALLAERLVKQHGYEVTVLCATDDPTGEADKLRPYVVRRLFQRTSLKFKLQARAILVKELLTHNCVLVNGLESLVYPVAKLLNRPYVLKVVGDSIWEMARNAGTTTVDFDEFQSNTLEQSKFASRQRYRYKQISFARHIITPSHYLKGVVTGWGAQPELVTVIPNGVDLASHTYSANRSTSNGPLRVIFVGRLTNWKGVETLLLATSQMSNLHTTIVGDGPEYPILVGLARQLGITERVLFAGRLSQLEVEKRMAEADVLVLTSLYEGMSHTLLEAMATGLPCIASSKCGNTELIDSGNNGILVEPQNVQELVMALRLLESDKDLRLSIGEHARATSINFGIEQTVQAYVTMLLQQTGDKVS